jgi:hypothetical protein
MSTKEHSIGVLIRDVVPDEDGYVEVEVPGWMPPYNQKATQEELESFQICKNCNEVKRDHMPDGKCYFAASEFVQKITRMPRVHPTKAHFDAADPNED